MGKRPRRLKRPTCIMPEPTRPFARLTRRHIWTTLGVAALALGIVGVVVPLLPTTPFLILAAYLFSRGSGRLHAWLVDHPTFGPPIRHWREHRAGESGHRHLSEFTMLEWYRLGLDDSALMDEVADLVDAMLGAGQYRRLTHAELLATLPDGPADLHLRFVEAVEQLGAGRFFITDDYPAEQAALARLRSDTPGVAARFELVVNGLELANGYHELTDAEELRRRMRCDNQHRQGLGKPAVEPDQRLLAAMRHGLPDCAGVALGLDRLVMLAVGASSIREVVPFAGH